MTIKKIELGWITVANFKKAQKFFSDMGLTLKESNEEWGWMEFEGKEGGMRLGVAQANESSKPGHNTVLTFTVDNLATTKKNMESKGVQFVGEVIEVPGHVKMATFVDPDGNQFQIVENIV
jgi:predicted enzyme related to lactoylglutathione lyase